MQITMGSELAAGLTSEETGQDAPRCSQRSDLCKNGRKGAHKRHRERANDGDADELETEKD
jgi:hypothetical protein